MGIADDMQTNFNDVVNSYGTLVRFRYFSASGGSGVYDDALTLVRSGSDVWVSGMQQPINSSRGSNDAVLVAEGKVLNNDSKLYIPASVNTSGIFKIGIGSPTGKEYSMSPAGVQAWNINNAIVYKKIYISVLQTGSLMGE